MMEPQPIRPPPNLNCLSYWFPLIEEAGLPVPKTRIVKTDADLAALLDGRKPRGYDDFLARLQKAVDEVGGRPFFLRTGHGSGKHQWWDTCYVDRESLGWHVSRLVQWSHLADVRGLPHNVWAVRRLIETEPLFRCPRFSGLPVTREFRVFMQDGGRDEILRYWPTDAVEEGQPDDPEWRAKLEQAAVLTSADAWSLAHLAEQAFAAVGGGHWSIDFLQDKDGKWWLTDMADGERSFKPPPSSRERVAASPKQQTVTSEVSNDHHSHIIVTNDDRAWYRHQAPAVRLVAGQGRSDVEGQASCPRAALPGVPVRLIERDDDLDRFEREGRRTGFPLDLACFSEAEARWFAVRLEARGIVVARISWLKFGRAA